MGSHLVPLCSDLSQPNRAVGSSERANARCAPVCPSPLQTLMPNGMPAAIRQCRSPVAAALAGRLGTADCHSLGRSPGTSCAATASP